VWSQGGRSVVFSAGPDENTAAVHIWMIGADGSGHAEQLVKGPFPMFPQGWSRDGAQLLYHLTFGDKETANGLWLLRSGHRPHFEIMLSITRRPRYRRTAAGSPTLPINRDVTRSTSTASRQLASASKSPPRVERNRDGGTISRSCTFCRQRVA
jgi:hypothetical protein